MSNQFSGRQSDNRPGSGDQNDGEQLRKRFRRRDPLPNNRRATEHNEYCKEGRFGSGLHNRQPYERASRQPARQRRGYHRPAWKLRAPCGRGSRAKRASIGRTCPRRRGPDGRLRGRPSRPISRRAFPFSVQLYASAAGSCIWPCCARGLFCTAHAQEHCASAPVVARTKAVSNGRVLWRMSS